MSLLLGAFFFQYLLVSVVGSVWWTPDGIVLGLVLLLARWPQRWLYAAALVVAILLLWTMRLRELVAAAFLSLALALAWAQARWNFSDRRVLLATVGLSTVWVNGLMIWGDDLWSLTTVALLALRVLITLACLLAVLPLWLRSPSAASSSAFQESL